MIPINVKPKKATRFRTRVKKGTGLTVDGKYIPKEIEEFGHEEVLVLGFYMEQSADSTQLCALIITPEGDVSGWSAEWIRLIDNFQSEE